MFLKKLASNTLIYTIAPQIPQIAGLFILPFTTKYLTPLDYGIYGIVSAYLSAFNGISDLGLSINMMNAYFNYPQKWKILWRQYHFYISIWSLVYALILAVILFFLMPVETKSNRIEIILLCILPLIFFKTTNQIAAKYYQFSSNPLYVGIVSALVGVISILLNFYFIVEMKLGYMSWFYTLFLSGVINFIFYFYPLYFKYKIVPIIRVRKIWLVKSLKLSLPVVPHYYSSYLLNTADVLILDQMKVSSSQIGIYNLAYTFGTYVDFLGSAIGQAIGPLYTKMFSSKNNKIELGISQVTHLLQYSFIVVFFVICLWLKEVVAILINNDELKSIYSISIIIIMGYAYRPYYWMIITKLQYSGMTKHLWKISFVAGVLNVILNIIFIPLFGIYAAAINTFIALLYIGFSGYFLPVYKQFNIGKLYKPAIIFMIIVLSSILVYLLKDIGVIFKILISLTIGFAYFIYIIKQYKKLKLSTINEII